MPTLNKPQKLFLALVGVLILVFQFYKFSEDGIEGVGWVISMAVAALLIVPALSISWRREAGGTTTPARNPSDLKAMLQPTSRAQVLYREVLARAEELADSVPKWMGLPSINLPGLPSPETLRSHWLQYSIPYCACLMFAGQIRRDMNFNKSGEFVVIYGQCVQRMIAVAKEIASTIGAGDKFNEVRAEEVAKKDIGEAEDALLRFIDDASAKKTNPDSHLLEYFSSKIGVPESAKPRFQEHLRIYTKQRMTEFARM